MSRPEIKIDWKLVDQLLEAGCLGTEIAAHFCMHPETFYDRVAKEYGVCFTDYQQQKRSKGDSLLRSAQFGKAMKGDTSMQIWLGKNRLGQRDTPIDVEISGETVKQFSELMNQLNKLQSWPQSLNGGDNLSNNADNSNIKE